MGAYLETDPACRLHKLAKRLKENMIGDWIHNEKVGDFKASDLSIRDIVIVL